MKSPQPPRTMLDAAKLPVSGIARIAKREGIRPRPVYQAHKWFARRFATTARALLVAAVTPESRDFWKAYYDDASCENLTVLDPFMGGGVMLLEAARLGAAVRGVDVEPVATAVSDFQSRLWNLPPLREALSALEKKVGERMAPFYESRDPEGNMEHILHAFWVQVVECAHCGEHFDAHPKFKLAWDEETQWVVCRACSNVLPGKASWASIKCGCGTRTPTAGGRCDKNKATCPHCGHSERLIDTAKRTGKPNFRLFALETIQSGQERRFPNRQRTIRSATDSDREKYNSAIRALKRISNPSPKGPIPQKGRSDARLIRYGYKDYSDLFNARQKLHLALLAAAIEELDETVREAMVIAFSDHLTTNNMLCAYAGGWRRLTPLFSIRAYRHIARPVEINPWLSHNGRGTFPNAVRAVENAAASLKRSEEPNVAGLVQKVPPHQPRSWDIRCGDARKLEHIESRTIDLVLTDPPYFDYISYSELGHFFVPWMVHFGLIQQEHLRSFPPGQLASVGRSEALSHLFAQGLSEAMSEIARVCKTNGRIAFTYQNRDGRGWSALATAMARAGIHPISAFPMFGDGSTSLHKHQNSISWDCVLVCKVEAPVTSFDLKQGDAHGEQFATTWFEKLEADGHSLTSGDWENLRHAGRLLGAFRTEQRHSKTAQTG